MFNVDQIAIDEEQAMTSFKEYQSKPITRKAYQIKQNDVFLVVDGSTMEIKIDGQRVLFKYHQWPETGDYIVYLNDKDIYHCSKAVFEERNIVDARQ